MTERGRHDVITCTWILAEVVCELLAQELRLSVLEPVENATIDLRLFVVSATTRAQQWWRRRIQQRLVDVSR